MAGHLLHYIVAFAGHLIIHCLSSSFLNRIADSVGPAGLDSRLIIEQLIPLNSS